MTDRPNVIVINCDDLGYGDIGCFGSTLNRTPRLDQMARDGMTLTDFYVASSVCSPSRAALMTGCHPRRIGLDTGECAGVVLGPGDHRGLHPSEITLATLVKSAGYRTKLIGKWHLGDQPEFLPLRHGFDSYFGLPFSNDMLPDAPYARKYGGWPPLPLMRDDEVVEIDPNQASLTARYTAEAIDFVTGCAEASEPFFLYLAHMYVHIPIYAPMRNILQSQNGDYGGAVEHLDELTGKLLDTIEQLGIAEDTLVIFTSDNGGDTHSSEGRGSNSPLRGAKGQTWEGGMRVPCIVQWKGTVPAGSVSGEITTAMDLLPTIAALAGVAVPGDRVIDGRDIGPVLTGARDARSPHEAFFYYDAVDRSLHAIRRGRWKLHVYLEELYDLEADVAEAVNLFDAHPEIVAELTALGEQCRESLGDDRTGQVGVGMRRPGWVDAPRTLTTMDDLSPTLRALYD